MKSYLAGCARRALAAAALAVAAGGAPAAAHPHVWVTTEVQVDFAGGAISGFTHKWSFDEFYTTMAVEGLDKNKDGKYSRDELAELAKVNVEGLKEFEYFTFPTLEGAKLAISDPAEFWLEHNAGILSLHFKLPLAKPVLADAKGFAFQVTDPSYFIAFDMAKKDPVKLATDAPKGCKIAAGVPQQDVADAKRLGDAFSQQLGTNNIGIGLAKTITVVCEPAK
jgi:ABC-type uncharacterized transport system substrate-binding protein